MNKKSIGITIISLIIGFVSLHAQKVQRGKATYYSKRATGSRTSSGEKLHHDSLTCAHRTYPFGTKLKVTNLSTGRSVIVKVTDRGPFSRGRIIDLSWRAAKELGMLSQGVAMVEVERADNIIVPFKPSEGKRIVEFDFESTDMYEDVRPSWREMKEMNRRTNNTNRRTARRNANNTNRKQSAGNRNAQDNFSQKSLIYGSAAYQSGSR